MEVLTTERGYEVAAGTRSLATVVTRPDVPADETPKPYLHPIRSLAGAELTDFRPDDHLWHHGLSFGFPQVAGSNLWGGGTYLNPDDFYQLLDDQGRIEATETSVDRAELSQTCDWFGVDGEHLISERRELRFAVVSETTWSIDWLSEVTNATERDIYIATPAQRGREDGGYGGLTFRPAAGAEVRHLTIDGAAVTGPGTRGDVLAADMRLTDGVDVRVELAWSEVSSDRNFFVHRAEPFPMLGFAPCYVDGLTLEPGGSMRFGHQLRFTDLSSVAK